MSTNLEGKVERLELQKGDVLVITFDHKLTLKQVQQLSDLLSPVLQRKGLGEGDVIVLDSGARLTLVKRAEDTVRAPGGPKSSKTP